MGSNLGSEVMPAFGRHVERWALEEIFAAGEAIEDLIAQPGWEILDRLLEIEAETVGKRLGNIAEPPTRAQYAAAHGRLSGLRSARDAAHTVLAKRDSKRAEQQARHEADEPRVLAAERG